MTVTVTSPRLVLALEIWPESDGTGGDCVLGSPDSVTVTLPARVDTRECSVSEVDDFEDWLTGRPDTVIVTSSRLFEEPAGGVDTDGSRG